MHIEFLEPPRADAIAREDASDGEFYLRDNGSVWYRNELAPGGDCFVNSSRSKFLRAVEALHRYNNDVITTEVEEGRWRSRGGWRKIYALSGRSRARKNRSGH